MERPDEFFVATTSGSLYKVTRGANGPELVKLASKKERLAEPEPFEEPGYPKLLVAPATLVFFDTILVKDLNHAVLRAGAGEFPHTAGVAALFLREDHAWACQAASHTRKLDVRWLTETLEVVDALGLEDDTFVLSDDPKLSFRQQAG